MQPGGRTDIASQARAAERSNARLHTSGAVPASARRVAIVAASGRNLSLLRAPLVEHLVGRGIAVLCVAPRFTADEEARIAALGGERATFDATPRRFEFLTDWRISRELATTLRDWRADAVVALSGRVMCLALGAARGARVPRRIALVNDLPAFGTPGGVRHEPPIAQSLLRRGFEAADVALFHNRDDLRRLERAGLLPPRLTRHVIPGAGVDLAHFKQAPLPPLAEGFRFIMISTLDRKRGVLDYCEAASSLAARAPGARFLLAGPAGEGSSGINPEALRPYAGAVTFLGPLADVRPALADSHVFVYPSHGEGMPAAILEAMAVGRPIVTTSVAGCRDTVDDRVNGCLVPPGDVAMLEGAMASFLKRPDLLPAMARASRSKAERNFDRARTIAALTAALSLTS